MLEEPVGNDIATPNDGTSIRSGGGVVGTTLTTAVDDVDASCRRDGALFHCAPVLDLYWTTRNRKPTVTPRPSVSIL